MRIVGLCLLILAVGCSPPSALSSPRPSSPPSASSAPAGAIHTGTHFADVSELSTLKTIGYDFVVLEFGRDDDPSSWRQGLEKAKQSGMMLIAGLWPPPYTRNRDGTWTIQPQGVAFLNQLKAFEATVMAVFVYNEPYSSDPNPHGQQSRCGFYSAADLRELRTQIQRVWPGARVYHDLGDPSTWAPSGDWWSHNQRCIGNKYADQSGVADYVGLFDYPFGLNGKYTKEESLKMLRHEIDFVNRSMQPAKAVVLGQSFASRPDGSSWPTKEQMRDWNCALRQLRVDYLSWYPWRQEGRYEDYLAKHRDYWSLTVASACAR
jgi:hypothetical protein